MKDGFKKWTRAFGGNVSMEEYLEQIIRLPQTGKKAREVAGYLLKK